MCTECAIDWSCTDDEDPGKRQQQLSWPVSQLRNYSWLDCHKVARRLIIKVSLWTIRNGSEFLVCLFVQNITSYTLTSHPLSKWYVLKTRGSQRRWDALTLEWRILLLSIVRVCVSAVFWPRHPQYLSCLDKRQQWDCCWWSVVALNASHPTNTDQLPRCALWYFEEYLLVPLGTLRYF